MEQIRSAADLVGIDTLTKVKRIAAETYPVEIGGKVKPICSTGLAESNAADTNPVEFGGKVKPISSLAWRM